MITGPKPKTHCKHGHDLSIHGAQKLSKEGTKDGCQCRACNRVQQKYYRIRNPEIMRKSRMASQNRKRYGMQDISDRDELLKSQGGGCAICRRTDCVWGKGFNDVWHIDHEHGKEGTYRGVLCGTCNMLLGMVEKNSAFAANYQAYLDKE